MQIIFTRGRGQVTPTGGNVCHVYHTSCIARKYQFSTAVKANSQGIIIFILEIKIRRLVPSAREKDFYLGGSQNQYEES